MIDVDIAPPVHIARPVDEARLAAVFSAARSDGPRVVVVAGEPGIGKTRLLARVVGTSAAGWLRLGCETLSVERDRDFSTLDAAFAATGVSPSDEQAVVELLDHLSGERPVAILIDDADQADDASLIALTAALRRLPGRPIVVAVTVRSDRWMPGSVFAKTVGAMAERPNGVVLPVRGFDRDQLRAFAEGRLGRAVDDGLLDRLTENSSGVPLYAEEFLAAVGPGDDLIGPGGERQLGRSMSLSLTPVDPRRLLRRVFRDDLAGLGLATHLAVVRRVRFEHLEMLEDLLDDIPGRPLGGLRDGHAEDARTVFDRLVGASILVEHGTGWHRFSHSMLANALYRELAPSTRREIHRRMISDERANELDRFERATHLVGSATVADREAIEAALDTAESLSARSPLDAAEWYRKALDLEPPDSPNRPVILARQSEALWRARRPRAACDAGMASLETLAPGPLRQRTVYVVTATLLDMGRCQEAAEFGSLDIDEDDDLELMAQRTYLRTILGTASLAAEHDAWDRAGSLPEPARPGLLINMGQSANAAGDFEHTAQIIDRLLALADQPGPSERRAAVLDASALLYVKAGCVASSLDCLERARAVGPGAGRGRRHPTRDFATARAEFLSGRWDDALQTVADGAARYQASGQANALGWLYVTEVRILIERLQLDDASERLKMLTNETTDSGLFRSVCRVLAARVDAGRGRFDDAASVLARIAGQAREQGLIEPLYLALDGAFETATAAGDIRRAEAIAVELQALATETSMPIVSTIADLANAEAFADADIANAVLDRSRNDRAEFFVARAHLVLATIGVDRQRHLDAARRSFESMVAARRLQRADAVESAARRGSERGRRPADLRAAAVTLTETENRLVDLVRRGKTNREIAEDLNYSVKTIEVYLSRLYAKLGCRSRTELLYIVDS